MITKHKILILKTNINEEEKLRQVRKLFTKNANIINWSVDMEDIDKVLRIESTKNINEIDVSQLLETIGLVGNDLAI